MSTLYASGLSDTEVDAKSKAKRSTDGVAEQKRNEREREGHEAESVSARLHSKRGRSGESASPLSEHWKRWRMVEI